MHTVHTYTCTYTPMCTHRDSTNSACTMGSYLALNWVGLPRFHLVGGWCPVVGASWAPRERLVRWLGVPGFRPVPARGRLVSGHLDCTT